jgi:adenylyltransferase/sulfurtransferase
VPGCGEAGVLGALCGVIGSLQAVEALKLVVSAGEPLLGRLLTYDGLTQHFRTLKLARDPACPVCGTAPKIAHLAAETYAAACVAPTPPSAPAEVPWEITVVEADQQLRSTPSRTMVIDVREPYEWEICRVAEAEHIPMRQIPARLAELPRDKHLLILCHAGVRSMRVTEFLRAQGFATVSNIAGGIDAWAAQIDPSLPRY